MIYKELMFERQRLIIPPGPQSKPTGLGTVRFIGSCSSSAKEIVEKAKTVLTLINHYYDKEWPYLDTWRTILPTDSVNQFRPERTLQKINTRKTLYELRKTIPSISIPDDGWDLSS